MELKGTTTHTTKTTTINSEKQHITVIKDTVVAWQAMRRRNGLSVSMYRYYPILQNPQFRRGTNSKAFTQWQDKGLEYLFKLYNSTNGQLKSFKELQTSHNLPEEHLFQYLQIQSYCKGQKWLTTPSFQNSFIDSILMQNENSNSTIYPHIQSLFFQGWKIQQP